MGAVGVEAVSVAVEAASVDSAGAARAVAAPEAVGSRQKTEECLWLLKIRIPEKQINEFVDTVRSKRQAANLESIILYGSAVSGDYETEYSNINLLVVLKDTSLPNLLALAPAIAGVDAATPSRATAHHSRRTGAFCRCLLHRITGYEAPASSVVRARIVVANACRFR